MTGLDGPRSVIWLSLALVMDNVGPPCEGCLLLLQPASYLPCRWDTLFYVALHFAL